MRLLAVMLFIPLLFSCTMQIKIAETDNIRFDAVAAEIAPDYSASNAEKIGVKTVVVLPSTEKVIQKLHNPGTGISELYTIPVGRLMSLAAEKVVPAYFSDYQLVYAGDRYDGQALRLELDYVLFNITNLSSGFSECHTTIISDISMRVYDSSGGQIYQKQETSGDVTGDRNCFSAAEFEKMLPELTLRSIAKSMVKNLSSLTKVKSVVDYLSGYKPAASAAAKPSTAYTTEDNTPNGRLRAAFERGEIDVDQLSRALAEISDEKISRLLDAFLKGDINGSKLGELY